MQVSDIKTYLEGRPFPLDIPTDEELEKYMNFSILIIKTFYNVEDSDLQNSDLIPVVGEEVAYLLENNPYEDVLKFYNYLKKFSVAGAISGEVSEKVIGFLGTFVKKLMDKLGFVLDVDDSDSTITYTYGIF